MLTDLGIIYEVHGTMPQGDISKGNLFRRVCVHACARALLIGEKNVSRVLLQRRVISRATCNAASCTCAGCRREDLTSPRTLFGVASPSG